MKTLHACGWMAVAAVAALPASVSAQVVTGAQDFVNALATENAIITGTVTMDGGDTDGGVAAQGAIVLMGAVTLNMDNDTMANVAFVDNGPLTFMGNGSKSLNGGGIVFKSATVNSSLNVYGPANQPYISPESTGSQPDRLTFNGNNGNPVVTLTTSTGDFFGFGSKTSTLTTASSIFAGAQATSLGAGNISNNVLTLNATGATGGFAVFDLPVATAGLASLNGINVINPSNASIIVNVTGAQGSTWSVGQNGPNFQGAANSGKLLWNLEDGINLTTGNAAWNGSILGIGSTITANGDLDGQVFAANLTVNSREVEYAAFSPIPEPTTYALILGIAVFGAAALGRAGWIPATPIAGALADVAAVRRRQV